MLGYTCWAQEVYKSALNLYFLLVHDLKSASGERLVLSQVFLEYVWIYMFSFFNSQKFGNFKNSPNISRSPELFIQVLVLINWHHNIGQQWWKNSCHWIIFDKYLKLWLLQWSWIPDESNSKNIWGMFFSIEFWDKVQIVMLHLDWFLKIVSIWVWLL